MIPASDITGLVLAGGRGRRMGGQDKGLLPLGGRSLVTHAIERLRPQVGALMVSANRHRPDYEALGVPVWSDADGVGPAGPLAGLLAGLTHCRTPWLLTVPCDAPRFPLDLAARLAQAPTQPPAGAGPAIRMAVAWARSAGPETPLQAQPVFALIHTSLRDALAAFIARGGRRASEWATLADALRVDFDRPGLDEGAFCNVNTPDELRALAAQG